MASKIVLSGNLQFLGLGDVLQLIGSNGSTGILRINAKYSPEPGIVLFRKGNIVDASTPEKKGLDAAFALFGWQEGDFEFVECPVEVERTIKTARMEIILDGLRLVDDGVTPKLGPVAVDRKLTDGVPVVKGPLPDYMYVLDEEDFDEGREIVRENKYGNWIWVIMDGVVDILKDTPKGPLNLMKLGGGSYLGSLSSFSFEGSVWPITAETATRVQLGVVDAQKLMEEFETQSREYRNLIQSFDRRRTELFNHMVKIYLGDEDIKSLIEGKKRVVKQGKPEEKVVRITKGEACIVRKTENFGHFPLATLKKDDIIGAPPFLEVGQEPERASVYVTEDFDFEPVDVDALAEEHEGLSYTLKAMIEGVATHISIGTRVAEDFQKKNLKKSQK